MAGQSACYNGFMSEPEVKTINRGGRPRKYQTLAEYKAASKAARIAKRDAKRAAPLPAPPAIEVPADAPAVQVAIATAVASLTMQESIFVTEVCSGSSLTQAYKKAFPNAADSTAHAQGSVFAAKPHIAKALATVKAGLAKGVAVGAHPGFADLQGFGRRPMTLSGSEAYESVLY